LKGKIGLLAVDATADSNKALSEEFGIKGFPSLKVYNVKYGAGFTD
jgi:hypothetical protein